MHISKRCTISAIFASFNREDSRDKGMEGIKMMGCADDEEMVK
jgi:hypothetical protein